MRPFASSCARRALILLALCVCLASPIAGQVVVGELRSADDRRPLPVALIMLIDSAGRQHMRSVTNEAGRFTLRAPRPGRYRLEAQRMGYETASSPLFTVGTDTLTYVFEIRVDPVQLPSIEAAKSDRGCARRADGAAVAALWNEIRKILNVAEWTEQQESVEYTTRVYRVIVDAPRALVREESRSTYTGTSRAPFRVAPAAELAQRGFSRSHEGDLFLLAPDAAVLTSEEFLDGHCFRLARNEREPDLIGLSFEPIRRRTDVIDIAGTLWVHRASGALRRLEYTYTNVPAPFARYGANGALNFRRFDNGLWIIESWRIQSPSLVMRRSPAGRVTTERNGTTEDGGMLLRAVHGVRTLYAADAGDAVIEGMVRDGPDGEPLANARVFLIGTAFEGVTDAEGRYRIDHVPAGRYGLSVAHELIEDVNFAVALDSIALRPAASTRHDVALPPMVEILRQVCPGEDEDRIARGLIYGTVTDSTGAAIVGAELRADWSALNSRRTGTADYWRGGVRTDANGRYYICWLPVGSQLIVQVLGSGAPKQIPVPVRIPTFGLPLLRVDFDNVPEA